MMTHEEIPAMPAGRKMAMTEAEIQIAIWHECSTNMKIMLPNAQYILGEADVLAITKSNFLIEYEIKRSRADFRADLKKGVKHDVLANGGKRMHYDYDWHTRREISRGREPEVCPNRFYYVVPEKLVSIDELPTYAGLIEVFKWGEGVYLRRRQLAPIIHRRKIDDSFAFHMAVKTQWKFWDLYKKGKS